MSIQQVDDAPEVANEQVLRLSMNVLVNVWKHFKSLQQQNMSQHLFKFSHIWYVRDWNIILKACEQFQLFTQTAQESPSLCLSLRRQLWEQHSIQHLLRSGSKACIMLQTTIPRRITENQAWRGVIGPQRRHAGMWCDRLCQLESHPVHSNPHGNLITAPQLVSDDIFSTPVTPLGPPLVALVRKQVS